MTNKPTKLIEHLFTAGALIRAIPEGWQDAIVAVSDGTLEKCYPIKRVALHHNACGKLFVVLYTDETKRDR